MFDDLRKIIESEQLYDEMLDLMMEASNESLADFFIEDDGEAIIDDSEINSILDKIPAYDEEEAMNKKLEKITECYIPESLTYVEEGLKDFFKGLFKPLAERKRAKNIKFERDKFEKGKKITMDTLEQADLETCKEIKEQIENLIPEYKEFLAKFDDKDYIEIYSGYLDWLQNTALPKAKAKINELQN
jgi:hypothetical protein